MSRTKGSGRTLSDWEIEEMLADRRRGDTMKALAARYGVCTRTVRIYLRDAEEREAARWAR